MALDGINNGVRSQKRQQGPKASLAILYGRVISFTDEPEVKNEYGKVVKPKGATFTVSFELRDLRTQQVYWSDQVSATARETGVIEATPEERERHEREVAKRNAAEAELKAAQEKKEVIAGLKNNKYLILQVIGGFVGFIFLLFVFKSMIRSR